jgi:mannose-6-phosphate isomerase-like protein (cupin superfamily)
MSSHDEVILETGDVRVRILALEGGQATSWHFHTQVTDRMFCLEGAIAVELRDPRQRVELEPGGRCEVAVERVHRVVNLTPQRARYLLVQGVGRYDFNVVGHPAS